MVSQGHNELTSFETPGICVWKFNWWDVSISRGNGFVLARQQNHFHGFPDSKVHGSNMGPTWVLSAPDGPQVGPMHLAIRVSATLPACYHRIALSYNLNNRGPVNQHGLTIIQTWISNYIHYKMSDEITYSIPNFKGYTFEILGMIK